ncbi:alpha/beta-hydrolase [Saccharata proteae CBS 121410]|uniref:Alpha/beta-hydrolase n=1 Tax=Saccharata proteae CBS 121410 TaxID=1314787 RepID=A0A9P4LUX6_9PEZI|nr:alpha/beta-hydrolase [Saccharata proteae CBS 121410]
MVSQCCATGEIHTGTPTGRVENVHGLDCYIASPDEGIRPIGVVSILPDIFGWESVNTRILADSYAARGPFLVYLPELQSGMAFPQDMVMTMHVYHTTGLVAMAKKLYHFAKVASLWFPFAKVNTNEVVQEKLFSFIEKLRENEAKELPVGVAGFCWGGYWSFQLAHHREKKLIDAAFAAHPSNMKVPEDIEAIEIPTSIATGSLDTAFPQDQVAVARKILEKKTKDDKDGVAHELVFYDGCHHGWALRGSQKDPAESQKGLEAEQQAVKWFQRWFGKVDAKL